jgi:hypothetical protein
MRHHREFEEFGEECCEGPWEETRGHHEHRRHRHTHHHRCCPCCCPAFAWWTFFGSPAFPPAALPRRFWTKEERITALERYLESLRKEAQGVEEEIKKLREG